MSRITVWKVVMGVCESCRGESDEYMLLCADSYAVQPSEQVGLVLTDPPYGVTSLVWDHNDSVAQLWGVLAECGAPIVSFGDFKLISQLALISGSFRYELVWEKRRPVGFLDARRRPLRTHELIGVFGSPLFSPQLRPRHEDDYQPGRTRRLRRENRVYGKDSRESIWEDTGMRLHGSVLHATYGSYDVSRVNGMHPTAKPVNLLRLLIRMYSRPGDLIYDPFMGSGSTGVAALLEGRRFYGVEQDSLWYDVSRRRLASVACQPTLDGKPIGVDDVLDLSRF